MLGHYHHLDQQGLQKAPADTDFILFFQVTDGVPAVVAGRNDELGSGGQNLFKKTSSSSISAVMIEIKLPLFLFSSFAGASRRIALNTCPLISAKILNAIK